MRSETGASLPATTATAVSVEHDGDVAVITMDDGKVNALGLSRVAEIGAAIEGAMIGSAAMVIAGRPKVFCAGLDLAVMSAAGGEERECLRLAGISLFRSMPSIPVPVVVACTGHAIAGGAMFLLTADYRIAGPGPYRIGLSEVTVGAPLSAFALALARLRLGPAGYRSAVLGALGDVDGARRNGFVDAIADEPITVAVDTARRLGGLGGDAFARTKAGFYRSLPGATGSPPPAPER